MCSKTFITLLLLAGLAFTNIPSASFAQTTINFETPALEPDSYYRSANGYGGFSSQGTFFSSFYAEYGNYKLWDNWALSNKTDTVTLGFDNQFSAATGIGQMGSSQYAVAYGVYGNNNVASLDFAEPRSLAGGYFTNTTYAYLAMAEGCYPATKFTRAHDDYFKLTIAGIDPLGNTTGSANLYLADFRDPAERSDNVRKYDYILNSWDWVNLSGLGSNVKSLQFSFTSSDFGDFGINTPLYFALDNLTFNGAIANHSVWNGAGSNSQLGNPDNWNGATIHSGDLLQFAGSLKSTAVNDLNGASFAGINWQYGTSSMTLAGNAIGLSGDVYNYGSNPQTLDLPIALVGSSRLFNTVLGDIEVKDALGEAGTASGITKRGNGKLILFAPNSYTGNTAIEAGSLVLAAGGDISPSSAISVAAGATLEIEGGSHLLGTINGQGTTRVDAAAALTATSITQNALIIGSPQIPPVPEPGTFLLLLSAAVAGMVFAGRRIFRR